MPDARFCGTIESVALRVEVSWRLLFVHRRASKRQESVEQPVGSIGGRAGERGQKRERAGEGKPLSSDCHVLRPTRAKSESRRGPGKL